MTTVTITDEAVIDALETAIKYVQDGEYHNALITLRPVQGDIYRLKDAA